MNAVVTRGPSNAVAASRLRPAAFVLLALLSAPALAFDEQTIQDAMVAQADFAGRTDRNRPQLEVSASSLPRFDNIDGSNRSTRIDLTYLPPRRSALGLSLGMTRTDDSSLAQLAPFAPPTGMSPNRVDLGLTWRYTLNSNYRFDVTAWRRMVPTDALTLVQTREPTYGARVEMRLGSGLPKGGFVAERGFLGLQLESGARVTLRRSGGKPMLYYRSKF